MKKILCAFLVAIFIFYNCNIVFADDITEEDFDEKDLEDILETSGELTEELELNSRIAVAYDRDSGKIIWEKEANKRTAMASTTNATHI